MEIEQAKRLTGQCVRAVTAHLIGEERGTLPEAELEELLIANRLVRELGPVKMDDGTTCVLMRCDPRILAAFYAFEHFGSDPYALLEALGFEISGND